MPNSSAFTASAAYSIGMIVTLVVCIVSFLWLIDVLK